MNRFKKELKRKGVMLENDYPHLPYEISDNIFVEGVVVDSEKCTVTRYTNVLEDRWKMLKDGTILPWYTMDEITKRNGWM